MEKCAFVSDLPVKHGDFPADIDMVLPIRSIRVRLRDSLTNLKGKAMSQKQQQILVQTHLAARIPLRSKYASIMSVYFNV